MPALWHLVHPGLRSSPVAKQGTSQYGLYFRTGTFGSLLTFEMPESTVLTNETVSSCIATSLFRPDQHSCLLADLPASPRPRNSRTGIVSRDIRSGSGHYVSPLKKAGDPENEKRARASEGAQRGHILNCSELIPVPKVQPCRSLAA